MHIRVAALVACMQLYPHSVDHNVLVYWHAPQCRAFSAPAAVAAPPAPVPAGMTTYTSNLSSTRKVTQLQTWLWCAFGPLALQSGTTCAYLAQVGLDEPHLFHHLLIVLLTPPRLRPVYPLPRPAGAIIMSTVKLGSESEHFWCGCGTTCLCGGQQLLSSVHSTAALCALPVTSCRPGSDLEIAHAGT